MSYASSAGIARTVPGYGTTCRKDVLRRVEVPACRAARLSPAIRCPHAEHVWDDGYHRSITTRSRP